MKKQKKKTNKTYSKYNSQIWNKINTEIKIGHQEKDG